MQIQRKLKIWLISMAGVLLAYTLYSLVSENPDIKNPKPYSVTFEQPDPNGADQSQAGAAEKARWEIRDPETKKLERIIGFDRLISQSAEEWVTEAPFMTVFEKDFHFEITADTGAVEIETIAGKSTPKDALFSGNVTVHIIPNDTSETKESFVYLDDVTFDSDRSTFSTNGSMHYISEDAELLGSGLEIVYNDEQSRLEFFRMAKLEFLHVKMSQDNDSSAFAQKQQPAEMSSSASRTASDKPGPEPDKEDEFYELLLKENVIIKHGSQMIFANKISIGNILWSKSAPDEKSRPNLEQDSAPGQKPLRSTAQAEQKKTSVFITCDGGIIVRPVADNKSSDQSIPFSDIVVDDKKFANSVAEYKRVNMSCSGQTGDDRSVLVADAINFDSSTENAMAEGLVELFFYMKSTDAQTQNARYFPGSITARKSAHYYSESDRIVFNGNVVAGRTEGTNDQSRRSEVSSEQLIVELAADRADKDFAGSDISNVTFTGDLVKVESIYTSGEKTLSHTRLRCIELNFDNQTNLVNAEGPGRIVIARLEEPIAADRKSPFSLQNPCYALVEGFDLLRWDMANSLISAQSDMTKGIHIGYAPIVSGKPSGRVVKIETRDIDINYNEFYPGEFELTDLIASGGIVYYEEDGHELIGDNLVYDAYRSVIRVNPGSNNNCMLDGIFVEDIELNLRTGHVETSLGSGPGMLPTKSRQ